MDQCHLLLGKTGSGNHCGQIAADTVIKNLANGFVIGKIHEAVGFSVKVVYSSVAAIHTVFLTLTACLRGQCMVLKTLFDQITYNSTHVSGAGGHDQSHNLLSSLNLYYVMNSPCRNQ